jgi:hypothetical protein
MQPSETGVYHIETHNLVETEKELGIHDSSVGVVTGLPALDSRQRQNLCSFINLYIYYLITLFWM